MKPCGFEIQPYNSVLLISNLNIAPAYSDFLKNMELKLLSCPLCYNPHFNGVGDLRTRLVSVATTLLKCPVCAESLMGLDKLTIHLFSHIHSDADKTVSESKSVVECHVVDESVQEQIDKSIDEIQKTCPKPENNSLQANEDIFKKSEVVKCDICNFSFTDKNILEMHQKLLHQTSPDKRTGTYSYHCHLCSKKFKMRGSLMVHLRVAHYSSVNHNQEQTRKPEKDITNKQDTIDPDVSNCLKTGTKSPQSKALDNKQWECDVCSKLFTTKYFLKKHKRLHTGEMPYSCNLCSKSFTFQQSYHKHMLYHSSEKPYVCNECGRAFKELSTLQNHARIHSGERPFSCETCGKSFRQRVSYLVHRRIHTGVMPYKCTACDKTFRYKVSQRSHRCPVNPPGCVVRVVEPRNEKCVMSMDLNTGSINLIDDTSTHKKSHIEISYNKADLQLAMVGEANLSGIRHQYVDDKQETELRNDLQKMLYADPEKDLFSMELSPVLPEVESLCLNNSPEASSLGSQEATDIIAEHCLDDFLYVAN